MNEIIPISLVNITSLLTTNNSATNSEIHIDDAEIIDNVQQSIGKGSRWNIIDILKYLISDLIKKKY